MPDSLRPLPANWMAALALRLLPFIALLILIFVERSGFAETAFTRLGLLALKGVLAATAVLIFWLPPNRKDQDHATTHRPTTHRPEK